MQVARLQVGVILAGSFYLAHAVHVTVRPLDLSVPPAACGAVLIDH